MEKRKKNLEKTENFNFLLQIKNFGKFKFFFLLFNISKTLKIIRKSVFSLYDKLRNNLKDKGYLHGSCFTMVKVKFFGFNFEFLSKDLVEQKDFRF